MSEDLETRAQDATERFLEDESLTEDLTDDQAKPLIKWLTQEARAIALDASLSDVEVSAALKRLRSAVKLSCKNVPEDLLADALLERVRLNLSPNAEPKIESEDRIKNLEASITEFKRLLQENPADDFAWLKLGDLFVRKGDTKQAASAYVEAAKLYEESNPEKAIQILNVILSLDPTRTDCQERLALLQQRSEAQPTKVGLAPDSALLHPQREEDKQ